MLRGDDLEEFKAAQERQRDSAEREIKRRNADAIAEASTASEVATDDKPDVGLSQA